MKVPFRHKQSATTFAKNSLFFSRTFLSLFLISALSLPNFASAFPEPNRSTLRQVGLEESEQKNNLTRALGFPASPADTRASVRPPLAAAGLEEEKEIDQVLYGRVRSGDEVEIPVRPLPEGKILVRATDVKEIDPFLFQVIQGGGRSVVLRIGNALRPGTVYRTIPVGKEIFIGRQEGKYVDVAIPMEPVSKYHMGVKLVQRGNDLFLVIHDFHSDHGTWYQKLDGMEVVHVPSTPFVQILPSEPVRIPFREIPDDGILVRPTGHEFFPPLRLRRNSSSMGIYNENGTFLFSLSPDTEVEVGRLGILDGSKIVPVLGRWTEPSFSSEISREHFRIALGREWVTVYDLESRNGTWIQPVKGIQLVVLSESLFRRPIFEVEGAKIWLGGTVFVQIEEISPQKEGGPPFRILGTVHVAEDGSTSEFNIATDPAGSFTIGRGDKNLIRMDYPSVSGTHVTGQVLLGYVYFRDGGLTDQKGLKSSTNGTFFENKESPSAGLEEFPYKIRDNKDRPVDINPADINKRYILLPGAGLATSFVGIGEGMKILVPWAVFLQLRKEEGFPAIAESQLDGDHLRSNGRWMNIFVSQSMGSLRNLPDEKSQVLDSDGNIIRNTERTWSDTVVHWHTVSEGVILSIKGNQRIYVPDIRFNPETVVARLQSELNPENQQRFIVSLVYFYWGKEVGQVDPAVLKAIHRLLLNSQWMEQARPEVQLDLLDLFTYLPLTSGQMNGTLLLLQQRAVSSNIRLRTLKKSDQDVDKVLKKLEEVEHYLETRIIFDPLERGPVLIELSDLTARIYYRATEVENPLKSPRAMSRIIQEYQERSRYWLEEQPKVSVDDFFYLIIGERGLANADGLFRLKERAPQARETLRILPQVIRAVGKTLNEIKGMQERGERGPGASISPQEVIPIAGLGALSDKAQIDLVTRVLKVARIPMAAGLEEGQRPLLPAIAGQPGTPLLSRLGDLLSEIHSSQMSGLEEAEMGGGAIFIFGPEATKLYGSFVVDLMDDLRRHNSWMDRNLILIGPESSEYEIRESVAMASPSIQEATTLLHMYTTTFGRGKKFTFFVPEQDKSIMENLIQKLPQKDVNIFYPHDDKDVLLEIAKALGVPAAVWSDPETGFDQLRQQLRELAAVGV